MYGLSHPFRLGNSLYGDSSRVVLTPPPPDVPAPTVYIGYTAFAAGTVPDLSGNGFNATAQGIVLSNTGPGGLPCAVHNSSTSDPTRSFVFLPGASLGLVMINPTLLWWSSQWIYQAAPYSAPFQPIMQFSNSNGLSWETRPSSGAGTYHIGLNWGETGSVNSRPPSSPELAYDTWHNFQWGIRVKPGDAGVLEGVTVRNGTVATVQVDHSAPTVVFQRTALSDILLGGKPTETDRGGDFKLAEQAIWDGISLSDAEILAVYNAGLNGQRLM